MKRLLKIALWSAIAAAFVGPGTVTTAATAGASFGAQLAWALLFSTFACFVLQEASARITITSGQTLGESLRKRSSGALGWGVLIVVSGAVILGAAAYEAGNILGGVSGLALGFEVPRSGATIVCGLLAAALLWTGAPQTVARLLALLVGLMGVAFISAAIAVLPTIQFSFSALLRPQLPPASGWLVLGLVGTTVVPYNLFLGSSLARGESLRDTRFGLLISVLLGGTISLAVLVVGAATVAPFRLRRWLRL